MKHAGWEGFYFMDLIFPLFLFLVGLILPIVFFRQIEKGVTPRQLYPHIIKRTLILIFLGLVNYGLLLFEWIPIKWSFFLVVIGMNAITIG